MSPSPFKKKKNDLSPARMDPTGLQTSKKSTSLGLQLPRFLTQSSVLRKLLGWMQNVPHASPEGPCFAPLWDWLFVSERLIRADTGSSSEEEAIDFNAQL